MEENTVLSVKQLDTAEAHELAELRLLESDLKHANKAIQLAMAVINPDEDINSKTIRLSLTRDSIMQFCACFGPTEPYKLDLDEVYATAKGEWRQFYQAILDKRDAYVAHRFGPDRQGASCIIPGSGAPPKVQYLSLTWSGFDDRDMQQLANLINGAGSYVERKIEVLEALVNSSIALMTEEDLSKLKDLEFTVAGDVRRSREKHRKAPR